MKPSIFTLLLVTLGVVIGVLGPILAGWLSHTTELLSAHLTLTEVLHRQRQAVTLLVASSVSTLLLIILPYGNVIALWGILTALATVFGAIITFGNFNDAIKKARSTQLASVTKIDRSA